MAAQNLLHRAGRASRYNLRGLPMPAPAPPPVVAPPQSNQTVRQTNTDTLVKNSLKKTWPIATGRNNETRGLRRAGNLCFRVSGLQALMHLPKFLNWILSHNTHKFPCRNLGEVEQQLINDNLISFAPGKLNLPGCPACIVKQFTESYWGAVNVSARGEPFAFATADLRLAQINSLDNRLLPITPGGGGVGVQQDSAECQDRLLKACRASTDDDEWRSQFDALFILDCSARRYCHSCNADRGPAPHGSVAPSIGIQSVPVPNPTFLPGNVMVQINQSTFGDGHLSGSFTCGVCGTVDTLIERKRIEAAPELLRVSLATSFQPRTGAAIFNTNPVVIPHELDLRQWQNVLIPRASLKYKLESVVCHSGGALGAGHWTSTVSAEKMIYSVNDHTVTEQSIVTPTASTAVRRKRSFARAKPTKRRGPTRKVRDLAFLKANPRNITGGNMYAVHLFYSRIHSRR